MVRLFTDSTCDLSKELLAKYNITVIPLFVVMDDKEYRDGIDITPKEIFEWSERTGQTPKTAAPSILTAIDAFRPVIEAGDEIIILGISEFMSTTCNVFRMAASELGAEDRISVIDSQNITTGIGHLLLIAAEMIERGETRENIVKAVEEARPRIRASFVIETLEFLHRGGRCSGVASLAGAMFKIHPKINVEAGKMLPGEKYRGRMESVVGKYAEDLRESLLKASKEHVFITHSPCPKEYEDRLYEFVSSLGIFKNIYITDAGCVICSHCGPGTIGILYVEE